MNSEFGSFIFGAIVGMLCVAMPIVSSYEKALDARCSTACAPMVGDDREGECMCADVGGWKPLREVKP